MPLRGDVDHIPLSHILQGLRLNGQEGVLRLEGPSLKRRVRVLSIGLRPLNFSREVPDLLKEVVLKQKILKESQFQNILSTWVPGSLCAGDFLVRRGVLTPALVQDQICHQLENSLQELFATPGLKYEFSVEDEPGPYEMFDPKDLGEMLIYDVNGLLMEAMRQADEQGRFGAEIRSQNEVFALSRPATIKSDQFQIPAEHWKELKPLLNGECTVGQIIRSTTLSSFEVYQAIYQLKARGFLTPLTPDAKKGLADRLRRSLRTEDAASILRSILDDDPKDHETRHKLIAVLEKTRAANDEVIANYTYLAEAVQTDDPARCREYIDKVLALDPRHLRALRLAFRLAKASEDHKEAIAISRTVLAAAHTPSTRAEAIDLAREILKSYPEEAFIYHDLAEVYAADSEIGAAVDCLRSAAEIHASQRDLVRLRKTRERILQLNPAEHRHIRELASLERRLSRSPRQPLRLVAFASLAGAILTIAIVLGSHEFYARTAFAEVRRGVDVQKAYGRPDSAREDLKAFLRAFPATTVAYSAQSLLAEVEVLVRKADEDAKNAMDARKIAAEESFARAKMALAANEYEKALAILDRLDYRALDRQLSAEARDVRVFLTRYFGDADELARLAADAERAGQMARSHQHLRELIAKYPHATKARGVLLPIEISSRPMGATVIVDGMRVGQTPIVLKLPPGRTPDLALSRPGYDLWRLLGSQEGDADFNPLASHRLAVTLVKRTEWTLEAGGSVETVPAVREEDVIFGTRNGDVVCVRQADATQRWRFRVPGNMDVAGGVGLWNDVVYFGSYDGKVYALDAATGAAVLPPVTATDELWPVKAALSEAGEDGLVVANVDSRALVAIHLRTGERRWRWGAGADQILGQPQARDRHVYVPTARGDLLELQVATGAVRRRLPLGNALQVPGTLAEGRYYAVTADRVLRALSLTSGSVEWTQETGDAAADAPAVAGDHVVLALTSGVVLGLAVDGEPRWKTSLGDEGAGGAAPLIAAGKLLLATRRGSLVCLDLGTGQKIWDYAAAGTREKEPRGFLARGVESGGLFFVGSEDHTLYCLSAE